VNGPLSGPGLFHLVSMVEEKPQKDQPSRNSEQPGKHILHVVFIPRICKSTASTNVSTSTKSPPQDAVRLAADTPLCLRRGEDVVRRGASSLDSNELEISHASCIYRGSCHLFDAVTR